MALLVALAVLLDDKGWKLLDAWELVAPLAKASRRLYYATEARRRKAALVWIDHSRMALMRASGLIRTPLLPTRVKGRQMAMRLCREMEEASRACKWSTEENALERATPAWDGIRRIFAEMQLCDYRDPTWRYAKKVIAEYLSQ